MCKILLLGKTAVALQSLLVFGERTTNHYSIIVVLVVCILAGLQVNAPWEKTTATTNDMITATACFIRLSILHGCSVKANSTISVFV